LIVSIFFTVFEKINYHNYLAKKETLDNSLFYNPIQKTAGYIFPSIKNWYQEWKKK
jgi:membrane protein required for colicin V production